MNVIQMNQIPQPQGFRCEWGALDLLNPLSLLYYAYTTRMDTNLSGWGYPLIFQELSFSSCLPGIAVDVNSFSGSAPVAKNFGSFNATFSAPFGSLISKFDIKKTYV